MTMHLLVRLSRLISASCSTGPALRQRRPRPICSVNAMLPTNRTSPLFFLGDVGRRTHVGRACYRSISTGGDAVFRFPPLSGKILVVGDGDFAYSLACAKANESSGTARITASSLDSEKEVVRKYTSGKTNLDLLARSSGVTLRHELNATQPGSLGSKQAWDSIVWNFPYPPNSRRRAEHWEASALLTSFFQNARRSLKRDGTVYLAMSNRQEGMWGLGEVANACGFVLDGAKPFRASDIDGYVPKRSYVDEEIPSSVSSETTSSVFFLRLKSSESAITEEICTLLTKHNGQLNLANFKYAYQQCYGRLPFPGESRGLKKILANLSESGRQFQLIEEGTTSCRISLLAASSTSISTASSSIPPAPSTPLTTSTTSTIEEEIRNLLDKNKGQLNLATFKNSYQQYYGRPFPPPGGGCSRKLKKRLHKLSGSGKNFLLKQEGTTSILCRRA